MKYLNFKLRYSYKFIEIKIIKVNLILKIIKYLYVFDY